MKLHEALAFLSARLTQSGMGKAPPLFKRDVYYTRHEVAVRFSEELSLVQLQKFSDNAVSYLEAYFKCGLDRLSLENPKTFRPAYREFVVAPRIDNTTNEVVPKWLLFRGQLAVVPTRKNKA